MAEPSVPRLPRRPQTDEAEKLWGRTQEIMRLAILGHTPADIANQLQLKATYVRGLMRAPLFQAEVDRRRAQVEDTPA
jgi:hypothetical protein